MKIAVTGGIGSGKSTVLKAAENLNVAVLSCDEINRELLNDDSYLAILKAEFPAAFTNGKLDKRALSDIIYSDDKMREKLNSIAHPLIFKRIKEDTRSPLLVEIPLINRDVAGWFDEIIYVCTQKEKRLELLKDNRGMDRETALKIMSTQNSDEELMDIASIVLYNTNSRENLLKAAEQTIKDLI